MSYKSFRFKEIKAWFNQPYPFYYKGMDLVWVLIIVFLLIFCFDFFFRPFNVNYGEHRMGYFWIAVIHALVPVMVIVLMWGIFRWVHVRYEKWTMGKEMLLVVTLLVFTGIGQWLIRDVIYDNPRNSSLSLLWEEVRHALLVGLLLVSVIIPFNLNRLKARNQSSASLLSGRREKSAENRTVQVVEIDINGTDTLKLDPERFMFARSEGNYLEIFRATPEGIKKELVRMALRSFDEQLKEYPDIMKVHRSYIANLCKVEVVSGNAQGYRLKLTDCEEAVPVSRSFIEAFDRQYK